MTCAPEPEDGSNIPVVDTPLPVNTPLPGNPFVTLACVIVNADTLSQIALTGLKTTVGVAKTVIVFVVVFTQLIPEYATYLTVYVLVTGIPNSGQVWLYSFPGIGSISTVFIVG